MASSQNAHLRRVHDSINNQQQQQKQEKDFRNISGQKTHKYLVYSYYGRVE